MGLLFLARVKVIPFRVYRAFWASSTSVYFLARLSSSSYPLRSFFTKDLKKAPSFKPCETTAIMTSRLAIGTSREAHVNYLM